jgi:hypothetical protein
MDEDLTVNNEIQLVSDGDGLAVIGNPTDVERFFLDKGLDRIPSKDLDLRRVGPLLGAGGAAAQVGSEIAANSGRWVKLTAESARAVRQYGLMATKTPGVSHAMIGKPGEVKQWLQVAQAPGALLSGPMALAALSTTMQQRAMQQQMDEIVAYLQEINEKVDDVLRGQKDAVLADMIGVDLVVEEALTVRDQVGRVSEVTWSKVQATSMTIARTQAYALRQLEATAEKLEKKADLGEIAKATKEAEQKVRQWLAVLARCFRLQDGVSVLELDRVLDASAEELDRHRLGLNTARQNRLDLIARSSACLLTQMDKTVRRANSKVLFHPINSPAVVRSVNQVTIDLLNFRGRLGIESGHQTWETRRWGQAATEMREQVFATTAEGVAAVHRFGTETFHQAVESLRAFDTDGDGVPDEPRALTAVQDAGSAIKGAAAGAVGSLRRRKPDAGAQPNELVSEATDKRTEPPDG